MKESLSVWLVRLWDMEQMGPIRLLWRQENPTM